MNARVALCKREADPRLLLASQSSSPWSDTGPFLAGISLHPRRTPTSSLPGLVLTTEVGVSPTLSALETAWKPSSPPTPNQPFLPSSPTLVPVESVGKESLFQPGCSQGKSVFLEHRFLASLCGLAQLQAPSLPCKMRPQQTCLPLCPGAQLFHILHQEPLSSRESLKADQNLRQIDGRWEGEGAGQLEKTRGHLSSPADNLSRVRRTRKRIGLLCPSSFQNPAWGPGGRGGGSDQKLFLSLIGGTEEMPAI